MKRFYEVVGIIATFSFLFYSLSYLKSNHVLFNELLRTLGYISLVTLLLALIARIKYGENWIVKGVSNGIIGGDLIASTKRFTQELPTPSKEATSSLFGNIIYRFTRIGLFAVLGVLIPIFLLWQQNQLLSRQNDKIEAQNILFKLQNRNVEEQTILLKTQNELFVSQNRNVAKQTTLLGAQNNKIDYQNERIDEQTGLFRKQSEQLDIQINLEESSRRSALIVMMSNIMDKIDDELREKEKLDSSRILSPQLIGGIAALSQSFLPYRFLQDSILIETSLSPERGQLLVFLVSSALDSLTYKSIYKKATFKKAYLEGINLEGANLQGINLEGANLQGINLEGANLQGANLREADLRGINLRGTKLEGANLREADLRGVNLRGVDLQGVDLQGANLEKASLAGIKLTSTMDFWGVNFQGADLKNVSFNTCVMGDVDLRGADLRGADLRGAVELIRADLRGAKLQGANIEQPNLFEAKVKDKNWIEKLKEWQVKGKEDIEAKWVVDTVTQKDLLGFDYYLIKPKSKQ